MNQLRLTILALVLTCAATAHAQPSLRRTVIAEYGEYPLYAPLYLAQSEGYFKEEGLDVDIVPAGGDEKVYASLVAGDAELGVSDPVFTAIAGERGRPGEVLMGILKGVPAWGVAKAGRFSHELAPTELRGLKVATYPAPSTSFSLQRRFAQLGGVTGQIVEIQYGGLLAALERGVVDVALENEPNVSLAESRGAKRVYGLNRYFPDFAFTGLFALPEWTERNEPVAHAAVRAMRRALRLLHRDPTRASEALAKRFPSIPQPVLEKAVRSCLAAGIFSIDGTFTKSAWDAAVSVRKELGDLHTEPKFEMYYVGDRYLSE